MLLALLGVGMLLYLYRLLARSQGPIGQFFLATGISPLLPVGIGVGCVLFLAVSGYLKSRQAAERFLLDERGLTVTGPLGEYRLEWQNVCRADVTPGDALGICVRDRDAVLRTHRGTAQQREWLATMELFGEWDFLFPRADLGRRPETVFGWVREHLELGRDGGRGRRVAVVRPRR